MTMARAINVTHCYGETRALDNVNLDINPGELVGLLGPNGAGKSTLLNLFIGLRKPTEGMVKLLGGDPRTPANRQRIGVTPQETGLPDSLRVGEVVDYVAAHFDQPIGKSELLDQFGLSEVVRRQTGGLSGGQKRRLAVALAFVGRPRLVFLDEPTTGLDVNARRALWEAIAVFHRDGGTVVLTSHYLEEVEALAQRVVVVHNGRILADDGVDAIRDQVGLTRVSYLGPEPLTVGGIVETRHNGDRIELYTPNPDQVIRDLVSSGTPFADLAISQASLEDAFLTLTNA